MNETIQNIQQARYELTEENRKARMDMRYKAASFIETADASECLYLINELIERVSSIVGEAGDLEDAACVLIKHIENEEGKGKEGAVADAPKKNARTMLAELGVEDNQIILVDGHHRLTACLELIAEGTDYRRIDCMQFRGNDADRIMLMLTSAQGKPLTPLEMGFQYKKLIAFGWNAQEIASKVGKSRQHVENMIELSNAPAEVHSMIKDNKVSATLASATVKKHGARAATMLQDGIKKASESGAKKVTKKIMVPEKSPSIDAHEQIRAEERERCAAICEAEGAYEIARIIRAIEK